MLHIFFLLVVAYLSLSALALPNNVTLRTVKRWRTVPTACGPAVEFYNPTSQDWKHYGMKSWIDGWFDPRKEDFKANPFGFCGELGLYAQGSPDFNCQRVGSDSNCEPISCNNPVLNSRVGEIRQLYYLTEAVRHLHDYLTGLSEALQLSSTSAALIKDQWVEDYYPSIPDDHGIVLKEVLNGLSTVFNLGAAAASLVSPGVSFATGAMAALFNGASGAITPLIVPP